MARAKSETVPTQGPQLVKRVVVPIEGSSTELEVQQWALAMATALGAELHALHISTDGLEPPEDVFSFLEGTASDRGVAFQGMVLNDRDVAQALAGDLEPTDLVIIGTRQLGREGGWDSTTEALIRQAPCPVQVLRLA